MSCRAWVRVETALLRGAQWNEVKRLTNKHQQKDLLFNIVHQPVQRLVFERTALHQKSPFFPLVVTFLSASIVKPTLTLPVFDQRSATECRVGPGSQ